MLGYFRLILAFIVVLAHIDKIPPGFSSAAVTAFFILSGFLITLTLHRNYDKPLPFYWNRLLRIYPLHLLIVAVIALALSAGWILYPVSWTNAYGPPGSLLRAAALITDEAEHYNVPTWTLVYELAFYAIAPFVVRDIRRIACCAAIAFLVLFVSNAEYSLLYGFVLNRDGIAIPKTAGIAPILFAASAPWFMLGAALYHMKTRLKGHLLAAMVSPVLLAIGLYFPSVFSDKLATPNSAVHFVLVATTCWLVLSWGKKEVIGSKIAGDMCYPVYMIHYPLLGYLGVHNLLSTTLALSAVWVAVEHFLIRPNRSRRVVQPAAADNYEPASLS